MGENNPISRKHGVLSEGEDSDFDDVMYLKTYLNKLDESDVEIIREIRNDDEEQKPKIELTAITETVEEDSTPSKRRGSKVSQSH